MLNLSDKEIENIQSALSSGCGEALTLVTNREGLENAISIIQTNCLPASGFSLVLTNKIAEELSRIYTEHQNNEIPFVLSGFLSIEDPEQGPLIIADRIHYYDGLESSEAYACQHDNQKIFEACESAVNQSNTKPQERIPFVIVGHNHPVVKNSRKDNLKIANNISTQDLAVTDALKYNAGSVGYSSCGFMTLMINHIGDLNVILKLNGKCLKVSSIYYLDKKNNKKQIGNYKNPQTGAKLGVFTDLDKNYNIERTQKQIDILNAINESQQ